MQTQEATAVPTEIIRQAEEFRAVYEALRAGPVGAPIADAIAVAAGDQRWCATRASGAVVCMGFDSDGGLGDGPGVTSSTTPVAALGLP